MDDDNIAAVASGQLAVNSKFFVIFAKRIDDVVQNIVRLAFLAYSRNVMIC